MDRYFRGRGRAHSQPFRGRSSRPLYFEPRQPRTIPLALGLEMNARTFDQINTSTISGEVEISDHQFVASYNLLQRFQNTIFVPGRPPVWTPLPGTTVLRPDSGEYYGDENAARFPDYSMEPAVKSIFHVEPSFDTSKIDVFGCGSTLGDILRVSMGTPQPFSFTVHMIGKTAFFLRRNHSPTELIENVHGYGHAFPERTRHGAKMLKVLPRTNGSSSIPLEDCSYLCASRRMATFWTRPTTPTMQAILTDLTRQRPA